MSNRHRLTTLLTIASGSIFLIAAEFGFAAKTGPSSKSAEGVPPVIASFSFPLSALPSLGGAGLTPDVVDILMHPAVLGASEYGIYPLVDIGTQLRSAHPGLGAVQITRFDNQILIVPRLTRIEPSSARGPAYMKMGFMPNIQTPGEYHIRETVRKLSDYITQCLSAGHIVEAHSAFSRAFDDTRPWDILTLETLESDQHILEPGDALNPGKVGMAANFVRIERGSFLMGSPQAEKGRSDNEIAHTVTLNDALEVQQVPVTQRQFQAVMGYNPSFYSGKRHGNRPVERISWLESVELANKMSEIAGYKPAYILLRSAQGQIIDANLNGQASDETRTEGFEEGKAGFRLATEAEGEYFTRAGSVSAYPWGDDPTQLVAHAWYADAYGRSTTQDVGSKEPNGWELYDTIGNVYEWRHDWYGSYSEGTTTNPTGPAAGTEKIVRGESFLDGPGPSWFRSARRSMAEPGFRGMNIGVRFVRSVP